MRCVIVLAVLLVLGVAVRGDVWGYLTNPRLSHAPSFPDSKLYDVHVGLDTFRGHLGAFGDFNSDR